MGFDSMYICIVFHERHRATPGSQRLLWLRWKELLAPYIVARPAWIAVSFRLMGCEYTLKACMDKALEVLDTCCVELHIISMFWF